MIKLEEGKFYKTRTGELRGPMQRVVGAPSCFCADGFRGPWTARGECMTRRAHDLIEEWEPPTAPAPQTDIKADLANEAVRIVTGARRGAYGTPENNFERIARFWTVYMLNTGRDIEITAMDVSPMMRLMKEARLCETPEHRDSHVDLIGYTLTGAEVNNVKPAVDSSSGV